MDPVSQHAERDGDDDPIALERLAVGVNRHLGTAVLDPGDARFEPHVDPCRQTLHEHPVPADGHQIPARALLIGGGPGQRDAIWVAGHHQGAVHPQKAEAGQVGCAPP